MKIFQADSEGGEEEEFQDSGVSSQDLGGTAVEDTVCILMEWPKSEVKIDEPDLFWRPFLVKIRENSEISSQTIVPPSKGMLRKSEADLREARSLLWNTWV